MFPICIDDLVKKVRGGRKIDRYYGLQEFTLRRNILLGDNSSWVFCALHVLQIEAFVPNCVFKDICTVYKLKKEILSSF